MTVTKPLEEELTPKETQLARRRAFMGANAGHAIEFYDYGVYGFLAAVMATNFFPSEDSTAGLLASFAVFALSFFIRPLGGVVFGPLTDKIGRKKTLLLVLVMMSVSTMLIGLLPTYAQIGIAAPILLVLIRLLQGLSAGGEVGTAIAFVAEYAGPKRRGYSVSFLMATAVVGFLLGSAVANGLTAAIGIDAMTEWGWRLPFLLAGPLGIVAIYIRLKLEDSPVFRDLEQAGAVAGNPLKEAVKHPRVIALTFALIVMHAAIFYLVSSYLATHLKVVMNYSANAVLWVSVAALIYAAVLMPLFGHLSDVVDRRNLLLGAAIAGCVTMPAFFLLSPGASVLLFGVLLFLLVTNFGLFSSSVNALLSDLIPAKIRGTVLAFSFNTPIALFGGTAPFISTWLTSITGNVTAPAWYFLGTALVTTVALLAIRPTDYVRD
ncbi:MFS transporter [Pseudoglutamicibacter cumminsii]|uniref:MFS transporter n=1 Tax=Pseudoglutamicibacter cumminsii TaxID=156979 RepID=UPI002556F007|nr:MFS transporter [Pseudoglutamicibacter cumminsii]MDZ3744852.1 MFS transporter [Pseudoglutamicibacter cumminsii]